MGTVKHSDSIVELATALSNAQSSFPVVTKKRTANVGQYQYDYADLADIVREVTPTLAANGLAVAQSPSINTDGVATLCTMLLHNSGEWLSDEMPLPPGANTPQGVGSAITYARRYALGAMLGIVTDDDEDGALATQEAKAPRPRGPSDKQAEFLKSLLARMHVPPAVVYPFVSWVDDPEGRDVPIESWLQLEWGRGANGSALIDKLKDLAESGFDYCADYPFAERDGK
jgi:hypothetical protein